MLIKNKKGFTLIELLISIAILIFIIGISYTLFESNIKLFDQKSEEVNSQNDVRILTEWLTKDLKNTTPNNVKKDNEDSWFIGSIKYKIVETGKIKNKKVFKLERESNEDGKIELVTSISEGKKGFNIELPSEKEPYYKISVTIIDKFNKDVNIDFKVSYLNGKVVLNDDNEENFKKGNPFIDLNNNGKFDGNDYRITFNERGVYDSNTDNKYKANCKLVFEENFKIDGKDINAFIVSGGIRLKEKVNLNVSGKGKAYINTSQILFDSGSSMNISENAELNILYYDFPKELVSNPRKLQAAFMIYNPSLEACGNGSVNIDGASIKITPEFQPDPFPPSDLNNTKTRITKMSVKENANIKIYSAALDINWAVFLTDGKDSLINISGGSMNTSTIRAYGNGSIFLNGNNVLKK